ncbi:aspartate aminotransferase family protein [Hydrogenophaga palleronii]|uniref:aspartate aminotransferase family protein n=1 Tax=Hydrogenophaga palleronii TaxID=65655 RepID=UPI00082450D4|nr:aminotransferase class III-fold pyridoxal phosphate-dependent enzyme [Hydrogenophaga palleronii]
MNLDIELNRLRDAYWAGNPESRARHETATAVMPGGNTRSVLYYDPFPLAIARGEGARLWDADGHEYTDFLGEFTAGLYGHSHPAIRDAVITALHGGINLTGHNLLEAQLAQLVTQRFPSVQRLRFTNSGTEANLLAIAAAKRFTGRQKILVFKGGYHGGVVTFAGGHSPINVPHDFVLGTYNDQAGAAALVAEHASDLAAILVEPMQGAGGCIVGRPAFMADLRRLATEAGALLMFDEVMTSRLTPGGRQAALGIVPDMTTLGKYIGGGMSFGAFGGREDVMALFDPRQPGHLGHAGTFNNNVLSMSAGIVGLSQIYTPEVAVAFNARGDALRERLNATCKTHGVGLQFTGLGSLMNLHATRDEIRNVDDIPANEHLVKDLFFFHMLAHGFYVARRGFIVLSLPLTDADLERFHGAVEAFVVQYGAGLPA